MPTETLFRDRTATSETDLPAVTAEIGRRAREASAALALANDAAKTAALHKAAAAARTGAAEILEANGRDLAEAEDQGLTPALRDRLALDPKRVEAIAEGLETVAALPEPVGL